MLRTTARIILNAVTRVSPDSGFVGHIGGDDFVFVLPLEDVDQVCREIVANFDLVAPTLYDEADRRQGFVVLKDRQGRRCQFPLMTLSIAVVPCEGQHFTHVAQIVARAAEVKAQAKRRSGSVYVIDRRRALNREPLSQVDASPSACQGSQGSVGSEHEDPASATSMPRAISSGH